MKEKFLIIRFSSIGDIVLTTPVVRCLKQQYPHAEIHYFTKPQFAAILESNPYIKQVHVLDQPLLKKTMAIKKIGFDYVIDLHNNLRTRIIKSILDVPAFSFDKLNIEKSLLVHTKQNTLPNLHIVDRYLNTLHVFDIKNDEEGLDYFIPEEAKFSPIIHQQNNNPQYTAIAIGAQHATKRLPKHQLVKLCESLTCKIILLGGKEDEIIGNELAQLNPNNIINYCGKLTLNQSAWVVANAMQLITHDTGLMHIAAALKKPIVSVWGNTVPNFGMYPYYGKNKVQSHLFEVANLSCRPCSKIGFKSCPKRHFDCMEKQDINAIISLANQGLETIA
ncbi:MAG: glycosyltransferase family 9 protein [Bacteroidota bacterium]